MNKVYVVIRQTVFFTEVYKICKSLQEAKECVINSVYSAREFTIVEKEI